MSAAERSGWRDQKLSNRHRLWGFNCPAADVDFLMVEFNLGLPVGLIEYRHSNAQWPPPLKHPTFRAIRALADHYGGAKEPLPFAVVRYDDEPWRFGVRPVNEQAISFFGFQEERKMTERQYVTELYRLRGRCVEDNLLDALDADLPGLRLAA